MRRTYYDHEPVYQRIAAAGGRGWDDRDEGAGQDSYEALEAFLGSELCPAALRGASAGAPGAARAIDLGCGGGQGAMMVAQRGLVVTGVDFSPTAIALARANAAQAGLTIDFRVADCLDLSELGSGSFELAIDNHTLHCVLGEDRGRYLRQVARLLTPGGIFFCETMSAEGAPDFAALGVDPATRIDQHRTRYWVHREELLAELAGAGFEALDVRARPQPETPNPGDTLAVVAHKPR